MLLNNLKNELSNNEVTGNENPALVNSLSTCGEGLGMRLHLSFSPESSAIMFGSAGLLARASLKAFPLIKQWQNFKMLPCSSPVAELGISLTATGIAPEFPPLADRSPDFPFNPPPEAEKPDPLQK